MFFVQFMGDMKAMAAPNRSVVQLVQSDVHSLFIMASARQAVQCGFKWLPYAFTFMWFGPSYFLVP